MFCTHAPRVLALALAVSATVALAQTPCENLKSLSIPTLAITAAESVAAGPYRPVAPPAPVAQKGGPKQAKGNQAKGGPAPQMLPAYCRVAATLTPSPDSDIKMELWLPAVEGDGKSAWNGKFEAVGGGGWAGSIS